MNAEMLMEELVIPQVLAELLDTTHPLLRNKVLWNG